MSIRVSCNSFFRFLAYSDFKRGPTRLLLLKSIVYYLVRKVFGKRSRICNRQRFIVFLTTFIISKGILFYDIQLYEIT